MNINETKHGFKLLNKRYIKDIDSTLYEYIHIKSGGKVAYIEALDTNCSFAIGFRTPPKNSTGVCHIIEHSVLCGSEKYPLKEPFVNLLKSSLNSFLNAFTASDWTMYPFASPNKKDYDNIMSIYLDAVFNPLSIKNNKAFLQEGWHLELNSKNDLPSYKGVVYNEMKGAMSSVDRVLGEALGEAMYKDTCYAFNSGGDPDVIPNLTYEEYCNYYKSHYTPENALCILYGKMDIDKRLEFIDREYYSKYTLTNNIDTIVPQKPLINLDCSKEYEIGENEDTKNNTYFALGYALDYYKNYEDMLAFNILLDALVSTNDSPLKKAILDAKLGEDFSISLDDDNIIPKIEVCLEKSNIELKDKFLATFETAVKELVTKGIDKNLLLASINNAEFKMKEMDMGRMPKGIIFSMQIFGDFLYGDDLITRLEYDKYFKKFKDELNNSYFEKILDKYILNSKHKCLVAAIPSKTLGKTREENMLKKMKEIKDSLSDSEIDALLNQTKELLEYQNHKDTIDELKCLPSLEISDVETESNLLDTFKDSVNGLNGIKHKVNTNGIAYLRLYFDLGALTYDELKYVSILCLLYLDVPTKNYAPLELTNEIKTYLGDLTFGLSSVSISKDEAHVYLVVSTSALKENTKYISKYINEVINNSKFTIKESKQIINQAVIALKQSIITSGMRLSMGEARSAYSADGSYSLEIGSSIRKYYFLNDLINKFNMDELEKKLIEIQNKIFRKENLLYSISGLDEELVLLKDEVKALELNNLELDDKLAPVFSTPSKKALIIPSGVSYNAIGNNITNFNYSFNGNLAVLQHIIRLDYLWNQVRVKGGAYGAALSINRVGDITLGSYRDPNVKLTYDAFYNIGTYLEYFDPSKEEFKNYIIGAVGGLEGVESTPNQIVSSDQAYLQHQTKKDRTLIKKEALNTTIDDIRSYSNLFKELKDSNAYTIGNETKIKEADFIDIKSL